MNFERYINGYNRMKKVKELLEKEDSVQIRNIKKQMEQDCNHIWLCMNSKDEILGTIKINGETLPNIIGTHYTVKCPICASKQVLYFPIDVIPDFSTEIFKNSYNIFIALLEDDINEANHILKSTLETIRKNDNFENVFNNFKDQLALIGYFINHENKILKITTGGK